MAEKEYIPLAQRQKQYQEGVKESVQNVLDLIRGAAKAATTDIPGLVIDVIDQLSGRTSYVGENKNSDKMFKAVTGIESTGSVPETIGGLINPENLGKAMILSAVRVANKSKNVDEARALLEHSATLESVGVPKDRIFDNVSKTYIDFDGIPKIPLSDSKAVILNRPSVLGTDLDDVLDHPELFRYYPELKNIKVISNPDIQKNEARFNSSKWTIQVSPKSSEQEILSTVLHEVQHGIQSLSGFSRGGTSEQFRKFSVDLQTFGKKLTSRVFELNEDPAVMAAAERYSARVRKDYIDAYGNYKALPGEQEARFTQATSKFSQAELEQEISRLLKKGKTPSNRME